MGSVATAASGRLRTLAGYEAMATIEKGQVRNTGGNDIETQAKFIAELFQTAA